MASLASAATITVFEETTNECWFNEGATYEGECKDLFYWHCDMYTIQADSACNVNTFSDTFLYLASE